MYDICLFYEEEEVGGFHADKFMTLEELVDFIKEEYGDIKYNILTITKL